MWLSRKLSQHEMQDVASAQDGTVTVEGGELAVDSAAEKHVLSSLLEKHKEAVNESVWKVVVIAWAHE